MFGREYMLLGVYKLASDVLSFLAPMLLSRIVAFVGAPPPASDVGAWRLGYLYAAGMFGATFCGALLSTHFRCS